MKMKKIVFSSVCALALCGTNVFANAVVETQPVVNSGGASTTLSGNDAFLNWSATPSVIDDKYKDMNTLEFWKSVESTKNLAIAFENAVAKVANAKTTLGVKGDDGSLTSGIYKDIADNEAKISPESTEAKAYTSIRTALVDAKVDTAEFEGKTSKDLGTYLDSLLTGEGVLAKAKTEATNAYNTQVTKVGNPTDGVAGGSGLYKEWKDAESALTTAQGELTSIQSDRDNAKNTLLGTASADVVASADAATNLTDLKKYYEDTSKGNSQENAGKVQAVIENLNGNKAINLTQLKTDLGNVTLNSALVDTTYNEKVGAYNSKNDEINTAETGFQAKHDSAKSTYDTENGKIAGLESAKTTAEQNFNAVSTNKGNATEFLKAGEALGEKDGSVADSLYAKKKEQEGIIQAAEDARVALDTAIKATDAYKNAGTTTKPGEGENGGAGSAGNGQEGGNNGEGNNQGSNQEPSEPNTPKEPTEAEVVADVDEFLGAELSKGVSKAAKVELHKAISKLGGKAFNEQTAEVKAEVKKAVDSFATKVVESKKEDIMASASSATLVQLNNMTKRLGEVRDMNADYGLWLRNYGGRMSTDNNHLNYYSVQLGADKVNTIGDDRLITGLLTGFDKINGDVKSKTYSVGGYVSYLHNSGAFGDVVLKYANTKHERDAHEFKKQNSFLASFEGGYRFSATDSFYVEPSLELITGHIGKYEDKNGVNTISIDSHTPFIIKPQAFVGGVVDSFTYRAGIGGVFNTTSQEAKISMDFDEMSKGLKADGKTKLDKNNHGFVSLGGSYKVGDNLRFNLGVERSFGGKITNDYELNATIRYGF